MKRKLAEQECISAKRCKNNDDTLCNFGKRSSIVCQIAQNESDLFRRWKTKCFEKFKIKKLGVQDESLTAKYTDICFSVLDEISLEGLDGITLEGKFMFCYNTAHTYTVLFSTMETFIYIY